MRRSIVPVMLLSTILSMFGCRKQADQRPLPEWANDPRKLKTEAELTRLGIPINRWLPLIEVEDEVRIRDPKEVAERAVILHAVSAIGRGEDRALIKQVLEAEGLWDSVSPSEQLLFNDDDPLEQEMTDAYWRGEAHWTLLWALSKVDSLDLPRAPCRVVSFLKFASKEGQIAEFISSAKLRPKSAMIDETDRIYRLHWAVRDADLHQKPPPAGLDPDVVVERHYALNWLTWYAEEWDHVTTDT